MKKILVYLESSSLGDTISVLPYVDKFAQHNQNDEVFFSTENWFIPYIQKVCSNVKCIGRDTNFLYDKKIDLKYFDCSKPIQKAYAQQLGFIDAPYIRPEIYFEPKEKPIKNKYVTLGIHSTSQLKYWNHPSGEKSQPDSPYWNDLCNLLRKDGITPVVVEQYELFGPKTFKNGLPKRANKKIGLPFYESLNYIYHSEFFIGLSSGLSWVAHSLGKPVVMISNFTEDWNEFDINSSDYLRLTNKSVCHGCWNKINKDFVFDVNDWYWCPLHKGTSRQFECHTSITPEFVMSEIKKWKF